MEVFSYFLVGYSIFILLAYNDKRQIFVMQTSMTVFVCTFINVGYFIDTDLISIDYYQAELIIQLIVSVVCVSRRDYRVKVSRRMMFYFSSLILSTVLLALIPSKNAAVTGTSVRFEEFMVGNKAFMHPQFTKFTVFYLMLAIILAIDVNAVIRFFDEEMYVKFVHHELVLSKILMIIVFIEFVFKDIFKSELYSRIITAIFGVGTSTFRILRIRGSIIELQGLTREGSHMSYGFMLMLMLLFVEKVCGKKNTHWIVLAFIEMVLTGTLTTFWCLLMLCTMIVVYLFGFKKTAGIARFLSNRRLIILAILFSAFAVSTIAMIGSKGYIYNRLYELLRVIQNFKSLNEQFFRTSYRLSSNQTRIYSIVTTLIQWCRRPLFGLGLGTTFCYSDTTLTLAEIGIMGMLTFYRFYFDYRRDNCMKKPYVAIAQIWMICNFFIIYHTRLIIAGDIIMVLAIMKVLFNSEVKKQALQIHSDAKNHG